MTAADHHYTSNMGASHDRLICACGHAEPFDDDFNGALERMNAHIRGAYTDEEWEAQMQKTKLATLDSKTGVLTMPPEGPKS